MTDTIEPCELLPWDSEFFGARIARVRGGRLTDTLLAAVERWSAARHVACLYLLADSDDARTVALAEDAGFRLMDVRLTFARALDVAPAVSPPAPGVLIRSYQGADLEPLQAMARSNHRDTRFFFDGRFAPERAAELYAIWIARSCADDDGIVLVAEVDGEPAGYLSCHVTPAGEGTIGLVGVGPQARGRGLGTGLVEAALVWFAGQGCVTVRVVTQGRNLAAQRLYQRSGFITAALQLWFHRWSDQRDEVRDAELHHPV